MLKILIVDDHFLFMEGLYHVFASKINNLTFIKASCAQEALSLAAYHTDIDLVLLDLDLPDIYGLEVLKLFRHDYPQLPIVILSAADDEMQMCHALNSGAAGYIHKSSKGETILNIIELILKGEIFIPPTLLNKLTSFANDTKLDLPDTQFDNEDSIFSFETYTGLTLRQKEILSLIASGFSNKEIAYKLHITESTVKSHVATLLKALNVSNRTKAARIALKLKQADKF